MFQQKPEPQPAEACARCHNPAEFEVWGHRVCSACLADWRRQAPTSTGEPLWQMRRRGLTPDEMVAESERQAAAHVDALKAFTREWVRRGKEEAA